MPCSLSTRRFSAALSAVCACGAPASTAHALSLIHIYNISTGRIIRLTQEEIDRAAAAQKKRLPMGWGKDEFILYDRKPEDKRKPGVFAGNPGCPTPEGVFKACVKSWAQEESVDMITCGSLVAVDGYPCLLYTSRCV